MNCKPLFPDKCGSPYEMGRALKKMSPLVVADPRVNKSIFRAFRDTRFSKDKTPYKTHLGIFFWEGELPLREVYPLIPFRFKIVMKVVKSFGRIKWARSARAWDESEINFEIWYKYCTIKSRF
ncbi:MAG: DUF2461 family protein [Deltaproteobacteria bacterium]|nr:DUF2461 family protein [Deltaproteobacteria bacterium]